MFINILLCITYLIYNNNMITKQILSKEEGKNSIRVYSNKIGSYSNYTVTQTNTNLQEIIGHDVFDTKKKLNNYIKRFGLVLK